MNARLVSLVRLAVVALASCASDPRLEESPSAISLVVADLENGGMRYGAGILVDGAGGGVTSWHLIAKTRGRRAMLHWSVTSGVVWLFEPAEGIGSPRPAAAARRLSAAPN